MLTGGSVTLTGTRAAAPRHTIRATPSWHPWCAVQVFAQLMERMARVEASVQAQPQRGSHTPRSGRDDPKLSHMPALLRRLEACERELEVGGVASGRAW